MVSVNGNYKPFAPVRNIGIRIKFGVIDMDAKQGTEVIYSTANALGTSVGQSINDVTEASKKYASLEPNLWVLDGSFDVLPDDLDDIETGVWLDSVSDENGEYTSLPYVEYKFANEVSTIGWTLFFDKKTNQYPTFVQVVLFDQDGNEVDNVEFDTSGAVQFLEHIAESYYGARFYFNKTSEPNRRIRLLEIDFGLSEEFDANTLQEATFSYGLDLASETLPSRQLTFAFDNSDKKYNLLDPDGIYQYLQQGQKIDGKLILGGVEVYMGSFTFYSATTSKNALVPKIQANDFIYALDDQVFRGGSNTEMTLKEAVDLVIDDSEIQVLYGDDVQDRSVVIAVPQNTTRREALRMLAQASMCCVWVDRYNVVHMMDVELAEDPVHELTADELYNFNGISVSEHIDMLELTVNNTYIDAENQEAVLYTAGEGKVVYNVDNPCVSPAMGDAVAAWLLERVNRKKLYNVKNRCDPAIEVGDTVKIHDIFGNKGLSIVTAETITFKGSLFAQTEAVGL